MGGGLLLKGHGLSEAEPCRRIFQKASASAAEGLFPSENRPHGAEARLLRQHYRTAPLR